MSVTAEPVERGTGLSATLAPLADALDTLADEDLTALDDAALLADLVELRAMADRLEAQWLARVGAADRRGAARAEGQAATTAAFLRDACLLSAAMAGQKRMVARRLADLPATASAFTAGRIGYDHVRIIATGLTPDRRAAAEQAGLDLTAVEAALVDLAMITDPVLLRDRVQAWAGAFDTATVTDDAEKAHEQREFHASRTLGGMVALHGLLDPEGGDLLLAALAGAMPPPVDGDTRTAAQRRADALVDVLHLATDAGTLPDRGGERPHIGVIINLEDLERRLAAIPALFADGIVRSPLFTHTGPVTAETARRLACDAGIHPIFVGAGSVPLDLGRRTRTVSSGLRRALLVRDGGCAFPGCGRPAHYCDAHHIHHWADGGPTRLDNLVLLCRFHHRKIHHSAWTITPTRHGRPLFHAPRNTDIRPPPTRLAA